MAQVESVILRRKTPHIGLCIQSKSTYTKVRYGKGG